MNYRPFPIFLPALLLTFAAPLRAQDTLYRFTGSPGDAVGGVVATVGDLDGDGIADLGIGSDDPTESWVEVRSGQDGALLFRIEEPSNFGFGACLGPVEDWDGDGQADFLVGSWNGVQVRSGTDASLLFSFSGYYTFGFSVVELADVNGDGMRDFLVGAPAAQPGWGWLGICSGADGATIWSADPIYQVGMLGWAVRALGDLDGDGAEDFAASNPLAATSSGNEGGIVFVFSGGKVGTPQELLYAVEGAAGDHLGMGLDAAEDADGDGAVDLIIGAPDASNNGPESGFAMLCSGADGSTILSWNGNLPYDHFGQAVAGLGDVDQDGIPDLVVGAPDADINDLSSGFSAVLSGADGSLIHRYLGYWRDDRHGAAVSSAGDTDLDGVADVLVGVPGDDDDGGDAGCARVFGRGFHLSYDQFVGGAFTTFYLTEATPNGTVILAYSVTGDGPTRTPYGTAELGNPIRTLTYLQADSQGNASTSGLVPPAIGVTVWFQALDLDTEIFSNGTPATIQ